MAHNARRTCGPIQAAKRKIKYAVQFSRTEANLKRKGKTNKKRKLLT